MLTNAQIGQLLVELKVLTSQQVQAVGGAGKEPLGDFVLALARLPAWWAPRGDDQPALTKYQQAEIRKKHRSPKKLARALRQRDYLVLSLLGEGAVGQVHKAWDLRRNCYVALKRVRLPNEEARRRLHTEFKAMRRLDGNPSVVPALEVFDLGKSGVLVMEFQNDRDLSARIARGPLDWRRTARWAVELLGGLAVAHELGLVHRDIKPSNVMVHVEGGLQLVRLSDWGLVKDTQDDGTALTVQGTIQGTGHYMPPEQWKGQTVGPPADLYALGCTLYHAVTGRTPFGHPDPHNEANKITALLWAHTEAQAPPSVRAFNPAVPPEMEAIIHQMMNKDRESRGTATDLARKLRQLLREHRPGQPQTRTVPPAQAPKVAPVPNGPRPPASAPRRVPDRAAPPNPPAPVPAPRPSAPVPASRPGANSPAQRPVPVNRLGSAADRSEPEPEPPEPFGDRPRTPSEIQWARDAEVPLGSACGDVFRALRVWLRESRREMWSGGSGAAVKVSGDEFGHAWRRFKVSLRVSFASLARSGLLARIGVVAVLVAVAALIWLAVG